MKKSNNKAPKIPKKDKSSPSKIEELLKQREEKSHGTTRIEAPEEVANENKTILGKLNKKINVREKKKFDTEQE